MSVTVSDMKVTSRDFQRDFARMNEVYIEFFGKDRPARTTIGCRFANPTMKVEIDCIAYSG